MTMSLKAENTFLVVCQVRQTIAIINVEMSVTAAVYMHIKL
jgi:hypothetical protein